MQPLARFFAGALILLSSYAVLEVWFHQTIFIQHSSAGLFSHSRNWVSDAGARWDEVLALKSHKTAAEAEMAAQRQKAAIAQSKRQQMPMGAYNEVLQTTVSSSPQRNGTKAVVVAATTGGDSTAWVGRDLPDWQPFIYMVDNAKAQLHTPLNKGKEANAYLWHIITHYERLAEVTVFAHAHEGGRRAWHNEDLDGDDTHSTATAISRLRLDTVRRKGYVSLRCLIGPGCPADIQPFRQGSRTHVEEAIPAAMIEMGLDLPGIGVPEVIAAPCCSQFAVTREQIRRRPLEDYVRFHSWLMETELEDEVSGRVLEYMWHIMFGQMAVFCPDALNCYCENYGMWCTEAEAQIF